MRSKESFVTPKGDLQQGAPLQPVASNDGGESHIGSAGMSQFPEGSINSWSSPGAQVHMCIFVEQIFQYTQYFTLASSKTIKPSSLLK